MIRNPILRSFFNCEVAQQPRAKIIHRRVIIHILEPRRAIVAAGKDMFTIGGEGYIFHAGCVPGETTKFLPGLNVPQPGCTVRIGSSNILPVR